MIAASGRRCGIRLRHALAFARELQRRVIVNRESCKTVAKSLGISQHQTQGAVRLLRSLPYAPSPERLALVVMRDHGMEDEDIAEIFGRSVAWSRIVRRQADEIRAAEPIQYRLEFLDDGLQPGDPSPDELYRRASAARAARVAGPGRRIDLEPAHGGLGIRAYAWRSNAFVPRFA